MARSDALRLVYEACKERCPMSFDRFAAAFDGWRVIPVERGGEIVATIMTRGDEICLLYTSDAADDAPRV